MADQLARLRRSFVAPGETANRTQKARQEAEGVLFELQRLDRYRAEGDATHEQELREAYPSVTP